MTNGLGALMFGIGPCQDSGSTMKSIRAVRSPSSPFLSKAQFPISPHARRQAYHWKIR